MAYRKRCQVEDARDEQQSIFGCLQLKSGAHSLECMYENHSRWNRMSGGPQL